MGGMRDEDQETGSSRYFHCSCAGIGCRQRFRLWSLLLLSQQIRGCGWNSRWNSRWKGCGVEYRWKRGVKSRCDFEWFFYCNVLLVYSSACIQVDAMRLALLLALGSGMLARQFQIVGPCQSVTWT